MRVPIKNAIATETKIARMTVKALGVCGRWQLARSGSAEDVLYAFATVPPSSSNTMDTVVEVGSPKELKISSRTMSEAMTANKINIISLKENIDG